MGPDGTALVCQTKLKAMPLGERRLNRRYNAVLAALAQTGHIERFMTLVGGARVPCVRLLKAYTARTGGGPSEPVAQLAHATEPPGASADRSRDTLRIDQTLEAQAYALAAASGRAGILTKVGQPRGREPSIESLCSLAAVRGGGGACARWLNWWRSASLASELATWRTVGRRRLLALRSIEASAASLVVVLAIS